MEANVDFKIDQDGNMIVKVKYKQGEKMPLPLILFAIKEAIVLGKFIATHAAATAAVTAAVSTYGAAVASAELMQDVL